MVEKRRARINSRTSLIEKDVNSIRIQAEYSSDRLDDSSNHAHDRFRVLGEEVIAAKLNQLPNRRRKRRTTHRSCTPASMKNRMPSSSARNLRSALAEESQYVPSASLI